MFLTEYCKLCRCTKYSEYNSIVARSLVCIVPTCLFTYIKFWISISCLRTSKNVGLLGWMNNLVNKSMLKPVPVPTFFIFENRTSLKIRILLWVSSPFIRAWLISPYISVIISYKTFYSQGHIQHLKIWKLNRRYAICLNEQELFINTLTMILLMCTKNTILK